MTIDQQDAVTTTQRVESLRSQDYRALMSCTGDDGWLDVVEDQLASWLRAKKSWDIDVREDGRHELGHRELEIVHHEDKHARSLRARLVERGKPLGTWTTDLMACDKRGEGDWISLNVENDEGNFVDVPVLAKFLMRTLPLADGSLKFVDEPQIFGEEKVDELIELLCDEERHGLVFVAGTDSAGGLPFDTFVRAVRDWTRQVYGLSQVIVLDPAGTRAFGEQVGASHKAPPWTIRTYLPGVDPASLMDARRHRILGTASLVDLSEGRVRKLLGSVARTHAAQRQIPAEVLRLRRTFERLDNQAIVEAIEESNGRTSVDEVVSPAGEATPKRSDVTPLERFEDISEAAERYLAEIELAKTILGVQTLDEQNLRRVAASASSPRTDPAAIAGAAAQIQAQQARLEQLEDSVATLRKTLNQEQLEHAVTAEALEKRDDEGRWLRGQLQEQGSYEAAFDAVPAECKTVYPDSFSNMLARWGELSSRCVFFTGDSDMTCGLDEATCWASVCTRRGTRPWPALADYIRARAEGACEKGVDDYLKNTPSGYRQIAPAKFAPTESAATMERMATSGSSPYRLRWIHRARHYDGALQTRPDWDGQSAASLLGRLRPHGAHLHRIHRSTPDQYQDELRRDNNHGKSEQQG
jgi:hypothetical protein